MKILRIAVISIFVLSIALFGIDRYVLSADLDTTSPVISADSDIIRVSVRDGDDALLAGVSAFDEQDGDLTSEIMIENVTRLLSTNTARITYIVFDRASNAGKLTRTIQYTDYALPRFSLGSPLLFGTDEDIDLDGLLTASDDIDGDISGNIRLSVDAVEYGEEGVYDISVLVFNSRNDSATIPLKVVINDLYASSRPIELSEYIIYLDENTVFDAESYIRSARSGGAVTITSGVNTARPGNYIVEYRYTSATENCVLYLSVIVMDTEVN